MASSKEYLDFLLEQLSELDEITYNKPVQSAKTLMPEADLESPYEGAKEMLLVDDIDNRVFLKSLFEAMYDDLPAPKKKK